MKMIFGGSYGGGNEPEPEWPEWYRDGPFVKSGDFSNISSFVVAGYVALPAPEKKK